MGWLRALRRWRLEIAILAAAAVAVAVFLVAALRGLDFGPYADDVNDLTMACRARVKAPSDESCDACCRAFVPTDVKSSVGGEKGLLGCTCHAY